LQVVQRIVTYATKWNCDGPGPIRQEMSLDSLAGKIDRSANDPE
jgi:hypothetical protein